MKPQLSLRVAGLTAVGALSAGSGAAEAQAPARVETAPSIPMSIADRELAFGQPLTISGRAAQTAGGFVSLQFRARGTSAWRGMALAKAAADGRFRFQERVSRSGAVRAVTMAGVSQRLRAGQEATAAGMSRERGVVVAARVATLARRLDVLRDRGPFVGAREFDLAGAVARKLGFEGVGTIWVSP